MSVETRALGLKEKILVAVVEETGGDCTKSFAMEDVVVWTWERDRSAWGLREYEDRFPDSDKVQKEMGSRGAGLKGVVDLGWVERVDRRVYRLTPIGLQTYANIDDSDGVLQEKASRLLEREIRQILEHPVFKSWLTTPDKPKYFREAGHFWGIAPGTPPKAVRKRIAGIDGTIKAAMDFLDHRGIDHVAAGRGRPLFERTDVERCMEFHSVLKKRFRKEIHVLDPSFAE